jgi:hypothetical protein
MIYFGEDVQYYRGLVIGLSRVKINMEVNVCVQRIGREDPVRRKEIDKMRL